MSRSTLFVASFLIALLAASSARAAGPVGHAIIAQKTINEIRTGQIPVPPELKQALADPECQRAFRGGAVAPDISEEVSHYGNTGDLAHNLVDTAEFYLERARKSGSKAEIKRAQKQLAFAYGWLSHCATDLEIHPKVNSYTGDAWVHNNKGEKTIHAAKEAQLTAYLARLYPQAAKPFDVSVPYDFMSAVTGLDEAKLRQAMGVLKMKAASEVWSKGKVTLSLEQLEKIWGPSVRASLVNSRTFLKDPAKMGNWDLDCGGGLSTDEFEALRKLVMELNGGKLPAGWGKSYVEWFKKTRGLSAEQRKEALRKLIGGGAPSAQAVKKPNGPVILYQREYWPNKQLRHESPYYLDANGNIVRHGIVRMWHDNGKLSDEVPVTHGKAQGVWKSYFYTGELMFEQTFADGKQNGPSTRYYRSGQREEYGIYENGKLDGMRTTWHENGQKRDEDEFENGQRVKGKGHSYDEKGREIQRVGDW